jgi:ARG and Rhodanese-Phosphatase-superfamily-associated Protein domain
LEHFARVDSQIGALFVVNGKVADMDCFGKSEALEKTSMKMIEGYAQEAADNFDPKMKLRLSKTEAVDFLQSDRIFLIYVGDISGLNRLENLE